MLISNSTWNIHNFWMELIDQLYQAGYEVLVVAAPDQFTPFVTQNLNLRFIPLKYLHATSINPGYDLLLLDELYQITKRESPAAILTFTIKPNIYGSFLAKRLNIKVIPTVTGLGYTFVNKRWLNNIVSKLYTTAFQALPQVILQNRSDLSLLKKYKILKENQGIILPGAGVNTEFYSAAPMPASDRFVFLFLGRILSDKGIRELAVAAQHVRRTHPQVEFWIAGIQPENHPAEINKVEFQRWIDQGIFKYWGWRTDVRPLIEQAQAIVLPSYREGLSSTLLEAMSMSRPLIVTDVPGCRETVQVGYNGWLAKVKDAHDLERCLLEAIQTPPEVLNQMGKNSREKAVQEFSIEQVNRAYLDLLAKITFAEVSLIELN
ncbi:glycosyltransferase family 4 protein [Haliscomenobacter sp.]|uniref:glycosyltransferase family 4 protein n=1 Tax=Haliscomenobacter sp. TaxID=2717303 RepID=UPI00359406C2